MKKNSIEYSAQARTNPVFMTAIAIVLPLLTGISRFVVGAHYPTDVLAVCFALNTALKLPFPKEFLSGGSAASLLVRCARYAVVAYADFGVYPALFRLEGRAGGSGLGTENQAAPM